MHLDILMKSIDFLIDDGKYDKEELSALLNIALADGILTDDEKRVLKDIFHTALVGGIDSTTQAWIHTASERYGI